MGLDSGEGVEVAGPAGTNLAGWTIVLYSGAKPNKAVTYDTINLNRVITNQGGGYGTLAFLHEPIQNGPQDGFALVNPSNKHILMERGRRLYADLH
ncbi:unnamed protein product [Rotaria sordida]|uniref:Uncharacterized protein n=1 Tax=Rotaria sordida TaxID=392033 RepID=A0A814IWK1_9BILA|nr:unnamed protein product [Rotaria sordida]CAF1431277.1 unnamed protein product [Rotaria sordida]